MFVRFLTLALLLVSILSCSHEEHDRYDSDSEEMSFQVENGKTRGFVDGTNINTIGTSLAVYGYLGNHPIWEGTSMAMQGKSLEYDRVEGELRWIIKSEGAPVKYYWNENGTYRFFGWLKHDQANGLSLPATWAFNETTKQFTIPETIIDKNYNQFDFIYSGVHTRTLSENTTAEEKRIPVPFELKHLFSSFGVGIRNSFPNEVGTTNGDVTIKKMVLMGIHDKGSAVIDYTNNGIATYENTSMSDETKPFIAYAGEGYVLPAEVGVVGDAFSGSREQVYYMVWPQKLEAVTTPPAQEGNDGEEVISGPYLDVEFLRDGETYAKQVKLPEMDWEAGKRYHFELQMADKQIELTATVKDWEYNSSAMDFMDSTISTADQSRLSWDANTCIIDEQNHKIYVKQGQPIEATFAFTTPQGAQWRVSLEGDFSAFKILDDASPREDGIGPIDGKLHRIQIVPQITNPDRQYSAKLKFAVLTADGRVLTADNVIQPTIYDIVLLSN